MSERCGRDRRAPVFIEKLSFLLVVLSALGAMFVLVDPIVTLSWASGTSIKIGGDGFSDQLKGAVVSLILVSGFAAVISYWLGSSSQGVKAQDSVNTIAQAATPSANGNTPAAEAIKADNVAIETPITVVNPPKGNS